MIFRQKNSALCPVAIITLLLAIWNSSGVSAGYASVQHLDTASIGGGQYSAGFVGNYAGHLTGGQAVSELLHEKHGLEAHDFSDDNDASSQYESLGSLGDHLQEHNFPSDVDGEFYKSDGGGATASDYAEAAAASTHHAEVESVGHDEHHYGEVELGHHGQHFEDSGLASLHDDFESKPVPGIDHGKGAFSYSTLYESKEHEHGQ